MKKLMYRLAIACWAVGGVLLFAAMWRGASSGHPWGMVLILVVFLFPLVTMIPSKRRNMSAQEIASLIERFLDHRSLYPQEWNDFVERSQRNKELDRFRKRCGELDPLVNCPTPPDEDAICELRLMIARLLGESDSIGCPRP